MSGFYIKTPRLYARKSSKKQDSVVGDGADQRSEQGLFVVVDNPQMILRLPDGLPTRSERLPSVTVYD